MYEGEWEDGFEHGYGIEYYNGGNKYYEGEWKNGFMHGYGIIYF
jgi:antitoxin component YwqK of YwqJK toxin-antitoxin module